MLKNLVLSVVGYRGCDRGDAGRDYFYGDDHWGCVAADYWVEAPLSFRLPEEYH